MCVCTIPYEYKIIRILLNMFFILLVHTFILIIMDYRMKEEKDIINHLLYKAKNYII